MADYTNIQIPLCTKGINKDIEPTKLESGYSPNLKNMVVEETKLRKRLGKSYLGSNLPLEGTGMEVISYEDMRGITHHIALTNENAYLYNSDTEEWLCINECADIHDCESKWNAGTGCAVAYDTTYYKQGSKSLKLTISSARSDGDKLAYSDDFGSAKDLTSAAAGRSEHLNSVAFWLRSDTDIAVGALEIVISEASAGAKSGDYVEVTNDEAIAANTWYFIKVDVVLSSMNAALSVGVYANASLDGSVTPINIYLDAIKACYTFTGDEDDLWTYGIATDADIFTSNGGSALLICNGVDKVFYFEGQADDHFREFDTSDFTSFASVDEIVEFWNHLIFLNYNDGYQNTRAMRFTNFSAVTDWTGGTSGLSILTDSRGKIIKAEKLGSDLIIYSGKSITISRYVGSPNIFVSPTMVYETGLFSKKSIWASVNIHYFIGTDLKFHGYTGSQTLLPIGKLIEDSFFRDLDVSKKDRVVVGVDAGRHKLYFCYPGPGDDYAKQYYCLNYKQNPQTWEAGAFSKGVRGFALFDNKVGWRCNGIQVAGKTCDESSFRCDASYTQEGYPQTIVITSDGYVAMLDESFGTDCGSDIEAVYETMDLTYDEENHKFRTGRLYLNLMSSIAGATVNAYYSTDAGVNWTELNDSPISLSTEWTNHQLPLDVVSRKIRFKLVQNSNKDLQIRASAIDAMLRETKE